MRFVQNNSLREIVEDAPSICERHSQRNNVSDRIRDYRGCTSIGSFGHCLRDLSAVPVPRFQFAPFSSNSCGRTASLAWRNVSPTAKYLAWSRFVPRREKNGAGEIFSVTACHFDDMIADVAEVGKALVWIQTPFFMGWGCRRCGWRDFIPRAVPTALAPSAEALLAFQEHRCKRRPASSSIKPDLLKPPV